MQAAHPLPPLVEEHKIYQRLAQNIQAVVRGQEAAVRKLLAAFFSGGHRLNVANRDGLGVSFTHPLLRSH
jgi:hypothetical protein